VVSTATVPDPPAAGNDVVEPFADTAHLAAVGAVTDVVDAPQLLASSARHSGTMRGTGRLAATGLPDAGVELRTDSGDRAEREAAPGRRSHFTRLNRARE
jgi:hypothetical protein